MIMYSESDLLPVSALQHFMFCERQCALIHIEQAWSENRFTAEGRVLHENVHELGSESRGDIRVARGLRLRSLNLGLIGQADVVELHKSQKETGEVFWQPFPIEYKRGKPKPDNCDKIQLCAQAMCLEEMLGLPIKEGAIFYGRPRRRMHVGFDSALRSETFNAALKLHSLVEKGITPSAKYDKKCKSCSLFSVCMPETAGKGKQVEKYMKQMLSETSQDV